MSASCKTEQRDRTAIVVLCALSLVILGGISWGAITSRIPSDSQTLLGVIVGGLMLFSRECLQAIRAFWQDTKTGKLTDQLAGSTPTNDTPQPVTVVNTSAEPVPTTTEATV